MSECLFCNILQDSSTSSVVLRDKNCWAFMDHQPVNPGHVLVIPTRHASGLAELDERSGRHMFRMGQTVAEGLRRSGLRCEGVNLLLADGAVAGQSVFHVHLHVIPRFAGDGFGLRLPDSYGAMPARQDLDDVAQQIQRALQPVRS